MLACAWLSQQVTKQLNDGVEPGEFAVSHTKTEPVEPFCSWVATACRKMNTQEKKESTIRAWEKAGIAVAWDHANPQRTVLFEEAKKLNDAGTLFETHSARRSKKGAVPRRRWPAPRPRCAPPLGCM